MHDGITEPIREWFTKNAELVAKRVPRGTTDFELTPGQVSVAYYLAYGPPVPIDFGYSIDREKVARLISIEKSFFEKVVSPDTTFRFSVNPQTAYTRIACMPTGTGKKVVTLAAIFANLLSREENGRAKNTTVSANYDVSAAGIRFKAEPRAGVVGLKRIAPLAVVLCPAGTERRWHAAAISLGAEVRRLHAEGTFTHEAVEVWVGRPAEKNFSVLKAFVDDAPTLWILTDPGEDASGGSGVLHEHPDVGIRGLVLDDPAQGATRTTPSSPVCGPQIIVRTVASLSDGCPPNDLLEGQVVVTNDVLVRACERGIAELTARGRIVTHTVVPAPGSLVGALSRGERGGCDLAELATLVKAWFKETVTRVYPHAKWRDSSFVRESYDGSVVVDYPRMAKLATDAVVVEDAYEALELARAATRSEADFQSAVINAHKRQLRVLECAARVNPHYQTLREETEEARFRFFSKWGFDDHVLPEYDVRTMERKFSSAAETLLDARLRARHEEEVAGNGRRRSVVDALVRELAPHFECARSLCPGGETRFDLSGKTCTRCGAKQPNFAFETFRTTDCSSSGGARSATASEYSADT